MSGFRFLLNPDWLRLANKINYDHGRGAPNGRGPGSLNLLNPLLLRHCIVLVQQDTGSYHEIKISMLLNYSVENLPCLLKLRRQGSVTLVNTVIMVNLDEQEIG